MGSKQKKTAGNVNRAHAIIKLYSALSVTDTSKGTWLEKDQFSRQIQKDEDKRQETIEKIAGQLHISINEASEIILFEQEQKRLESRILFFLNTADVENLKMEYGYIVNILQERIETIQGLSERDRKIMSSLYHIEEQAPRKMKDVGLEFGISSNRIMQIRDKIFRKIRGKIRQELKSTGNSYYVQASQ